MPEEEKEEVKLSSEELDKELATYLHDFNCWIRIINTRLEVLATVTDSQTRCLQLLQTIIQAKDKTIDEIAQAVADEKEHLDKLLQVLGEGGSSE